MEEKKSKKIICWDLDENIGYFGKIAREIICKLKGIPAPKYEKFQKKAELRNGIKQVLENLSNQGYQHVITTSANIPGYPEECLIRTGISGEFSGIYQRDKTKKYNGRGKSYEDIAKDYGLTEEEIFDKIITIGNSYADQPINLEKLVFILQPMSWKCDAKIAQKVIMKLKEANNKSFYQAFEHLSNLNTHVDEKFRELDKFIGMDLNHRAKTPYNLVQLNDNLAISLGYSEQQNNGLTELHPTDEKNRCIRKTFYGPVIKVLATKELENPVEEFG